MAKAKQTNTEISKTESSKKEPKKQKSVKQAQSNEPQLLDTKPSISLHDKHAIKDELQKLNFIPSNKTKRIVLISILLLCTCIGFIIGLITGARIQNNMIERRISRLEYVAGYGNSSERTKKHHSMSCIDESSKQNENSNRRSVLWR